MSRKYLMIAFSGMIVFSGCQSWTSKPGASTPSAKKSSWFKFGKKEYQTPQSMAVIWKEDTIFVPGKAPTRGFGGRVYFYNEKSQAIPVEGELTVYGYDESQPNHLKTNPDQADKKFKFTSEQFTQHFSESQLGASYSIWIPWDEIGGATKKIALLPTFVTVDGKLVRGESSTQVLPGQGPSVQPGMDGSAVQAVSYNEITGTTTNTSSDPNTSMRTTTIGLPSQMAQRLTQPVKPNASSMPGQFQQPGTDAKAAQIYEMLQQMNQKNAAPSAVQPAYGTAVKPDSATTTNSSVMPASTFLSAPAWPNAPLGR